MPISILSNQEDEWVSLVPRDTKFEKTDSLAAGLPPSQYEASCQKEIVFPFYLVASKNVMKSVFARKSRIGSKSSAANEIV